MSIIVVLDCATLGDLDLSPLKKFGEVRIFTNTEPDQVSERALGADVLVTKDVRVTTDHLEALPHLKVVQLLTTGLNLIDLEEARQRGVRVWNVPAYSTEAVAQLTMTAILTLSTSYVRYANEKRLWPQSALFTRLDYPMMELNGRTLGLVGCGAIGTRVAELAQAFGLRVFGLKRPGTTPKNTAIERLDLGTLLAESDFLSLHAPLTKDTERFLNNETIPLMKRGSFLVNTSRGALVDEAALAQALSSGHLGGAALDVLDKEPPDRENPLIVLEHPLLHITPHIGWATRESRDRLLKTVIENFEARREGRTSPGFVI